MYYIYSDILIDMTKLDSKEAKEVIEKLSEQEFVDWAISIDLDLGEDHSFENQKKLYPGAIDQRNHMLKLINKHPHIKPALGIMDDIILEYNKLGVIDDKQDMKSILYKILYKYVKLTDMLIDCGFGA